jgi:hypothetical protein
MLPALGTSFNCKQTLHTPNVEGVADAHFPAKTFWRHTSNSTSLTGINYGAHREYGVVIQY